MSDVKPTRSFVFQFPSHLLALKSSSFLFSPSLAFLLFLLLSAVMLGGCAAQLSPYDKIYASLHQGHPEQADQILAAAESSYGSNSKLLYLMDRGMTLHLAGKYKESADYLEQANDYLEDLYTRHLRQEALSVMMNDAQRPFRGDPYEQVLINVIDALNYARLGNLEEALVEARRIDHRLNVLADTVDKEDYHEDPFARYLSGVLYEANGDLSNAFVGYRLAFKAYQDAQPWSGVPIPDLVKSDLLRITHRLNLVNEHEEYRRAFPEISWNPQGPENRAEVVVVGYHGRAPRLEDRFIDVPVSLNALALVLQTKQLGRGQPPRPGGMDAVLYGLQGEIVRISLPRVVPQKTQVQYGRISILGDGNNDTVHTELMNSVTAEAQKNLSDRLPSVTLRAVARAALKMSAAEGIGYGAGAAVKDQETRDIIQLLVSTLLKVLATTTEEADKRSWRTLPDEIQIARMFLVPGSVTLTYQPVSRTGEPIGSPVEYPLVLRSGETRFLTVYAAE